MMSRYLRLFWSKLFSSNDYKKLALGSSIGILTGMLPIMGIRLPVIVLIAILFNINIISMIIGVVVTIVFPFIHLLSFYVGGNLAGYEVPIFNLRYLSITHLITWTQSSRYYLAGSIISGILAAALLNPFFRLLYRNRDKEKFVYGDINHVFKDITGNRWSFLKKFSFIAAFILLICISAFGISLSINPFLPNVNLKKDDSTISISKLNEMLNRKILLKELHSEEKNLKTFQFDYRKHHRPKAKIFKGNRQVIGFYVSWDENSLTSLKRNIKDMTMVVPNWYSLNSKGNLTVDRQHNVDEIVKGNGVKLLPLINNYNGKVWDDKLVHRILTSNSLRTELINSLFSDAKVNNYSGVNIDFENLTAKDCKLYVKFINDLSKLFHSNGMLVTVDVPAKDKNFDYEGISENADYLIAMLYDEHFDEGDAGPVASLQWIKDIMVNSDIPENKIIAGLGSYGYDWDLNNKLPADTLTYSDIMEMVNLDGLSIQWDRGSFTPCMTYKDGDDDHIVWFLDAASFYDQMLAAEDSGYAGAALWRLGSEDQGVWEVLKNINNLNKSIEGLTVLHSPTPVHYSGKGEILKIVSTGKAGRRTFSLDDNGYVTGEDYKSYPTPYEVVRNGKPKDKEIVLSFDDGPSSAYTPQILDILKKYNIKADFFIVGENGASNPDLIEREYREGHELGNHTYTHPNVADVSPRTSRLELNSTQRLIQELTGHSALMFRPPYVADAEPSTPNELLPIVRAQQVGYTMIGELIDPSDWERPSSDVIIKRVMDQLPLGNIILLHDAGGNRENTVKALPVIIEKLRAKGYRFVTVSHLMGKTRDDIMPVVQKSEDTFLLYDKVVFTLMFIWNNIIAFLFYIAIILGIFRLFFLVVLSYREHSRNKKLEYSENYKPDVSVIIAAYNEESVIEKTIRSLLKSDYDKMEIIIVNDGSKDNTALVVEEKFGDDDRVILINKENGGKSSAINLGYENAKGEIIVAIDADTIISKDAVSKLVRHFDDKSIAAVSGNIKVGNIHNLITLWQHVEYVTGFNLEKKAFSAINCITVVPGAIGAWRKDAVIKAGLFKDDTLAEDTDITLTLLEHGYRITYEEDACAYTESPGDIKSLLKQRFRWSYGTLQCLWKHKGSLFSKKQKALGFAGLPNMWIFQYLFQSISPLTDIYFAVGLFGSSREKVLVYYLMFLMVDYAASIYAFRLEKANLKPLILLFLQRLVYRQFMTFVIVKSIVTAVKGITVGWNKLQRKGNVSE